MYNSSAIDAGVTADYMFIDTAGQPLNHNPFGDAVNANYNNIMESIGLQRVEFVDMPLRLQLLLGCDGSGVSSGNLNWLRKPIINTETAARSDPDVRTWRRGRVVLANYRGTAVTYQAGEYERVGMIDLSMPVPPNLFPPSFMFLQLVTQGTRSKVLGHDAERAGWSVPCSSNQFRSKYDNFPGVQSQAVAEDWDAQNVRSCPAVYNHEEHNRFTVKDFMYDGTQFDPVPYKAGEVAHTASGITELHNFSLVRAPALASGGAGLSNHKFGSRFIHFGDADGVAFAQKQSRAEKQFGLKQMVQAPTFTVSMIDPNWIYTDVPNSTLQSLDVVVMWGDTSENVVGSSAYPVQVTLVAGQ